MKVLILTPWYPGPGGPVIGVFIERFARCIAATHDVVVVHLDAVASDSGLSVSEGAPRVVRWSQRLPVGGGIGNRVRRAWMLTAGVVVGARRAYAKAVELMGPPDVIHVHVLYPTVLGLLALSPKAPWVFTEHSSEYLTADGSYDAAGWWRRTVTAFAARRAAGRSAVGTALAEAMGARGHGDGFSIVPNIVDAAAPVAPLPETTPRQFVAVALLADRDKNISGLLHACARLVLRRDDFVLRIVGDGPDRAALEALAVRLGLEGHVVFEGLATHERVLQAIGESVFAVTPSNYETFSVSTAEALCLGRPVVSTRCGGPEDFVGAGDGLLVECRDEAAMTEALDRMLDGYAAYDPAAISARARARFSCDAVRGAADALYAGALRRTGERR